MNNGNDIRMIYEAYVTESSDESHANDNEDRLAKIGFRLDINERGDNDGDRYYTTVELYPVENKYSNGPPLDWDYLGRNDDMNDIAAKVISNYERTGKPTL